MPWNGTIWIPYESMDVNTTSLLGMAQYDNSVTGGIFGLMVIIAVFMISLVGMSLNYKEDALPFSLFITMIVSYLLAAIDIVADEIAWGITFVLIGSFVLLWVARR